MKNDALTNTVRSREERYLAALRRWEADPTVRNSGRMRRAREELRRTRESVEALLAGKAEEAA